MFYCPNCGQVLNDDEYVCNNCGTQFQAYNYNNAGGETQDLNQQTYYVNPYDTAQQCNNQQQYEYQQQQMYQNNYQNQYVEQKNEDFLIKEKNFTAKYIFELLAIICGLFVIVQMFLPIASFENGDKTISISSYEALMCSVDYIMDLNVNKIDFTDLLVLFFSVSALLPIFSLIFGLATIFAKVFSLFVVKKNRKVKLGGICSLLSLEIFYYVFAEMLLFTEYSSANTSLEMKNINVSILPGWWIIVLLILALIFYGLCINSKENRFINKVQDRENTLILVFSSIFIVISLLACFLLQKPVYKMNDINMTPIMTVYMSSDFMLDASEYTKEYNRDIKNYDNEYIEENYEVLPEELVEEVSMTIVMMIIVVILSIALIVGFLGFVRNAVYSVTYRKYKSISNIVSAVLIGMIVYAQQKVVGYISNVSYIEESDIDVTLSASSTAIYVVIAMIVLLNIVYIVLRQTKLIKVDRIDAGIR